MTTLHNNLFDYMPENINNENVSLAGTMISAYDNMNDNIADLVDIIKSGGKPHTVRKNKKNNEACNLSTIKEKSTDYIHNISPNDSISNIGENNTSDFDILNELNKINLHTHAQQEKNQSFLSIDKNVPPVNLDDIDINNNIAMFSSTLQQEHNATTVNHIQPNNTSYSKSVFETSDIPLSSPSSPTNSQSIFDTNKTVLSPEQSIVGNDASYTGGYDSGNNLLIAIFVIGLFCIIGFSSVCNMLDSNIVYIVSFILLIGGIIMFVDKFQK
tara:strand:+ start:1162 stop:1974 length:813 start_codon:yes stop_codon:yes gene_type:complete